MLLAALDAWVRQDTPPPESRHPRLSDRTLVAHEDLKFPPVPFVQWPTNVPGGYRSDVPGPYSALPFLVSKVDVDGSDLGGIRARNARGRATRGSRSPSGAETEPTT
jgi:hypothetical protein